MRYVYDKTLDKVVPKHERTDAPRVTNVMGDQKPYESLMGDGKAVYDKKGRLIEYRPRVIDGRREHREYLARNNKRVLEPGEMEAHLKDRARQREELARSIDHAHAEYRHQEAHGSVEVARMVRR